MKRTLSAFAALVAAVTVGALVLTVGPVGAHDSDDDRRGRMSGHGMMGHMMDQNMMGPGMMGRGMMGPGYGMGMGPGYGMGMGPGYGMGMGPGYGMGMGPGYGMMGYGMGPCQQGQADADRDLSVKDVTKMLQLRLDHWGNKRLKIGKVEQKDDDTIVAEIVTVDDSLVQRLLFNRDTGRQRLIN